MTKKLAPLWLLLLTLAVYAPALRNGFVWDDQALVLRDPLIRSWRLIGEGFAHYLYTDAGSSNLYRPLLRLSYTLDYAVFFLSPFGYHLVSLLWHAAAVVAFFYLAEEFLDRCRMEAGRRFWVAFSAATIWALHPVQSIAVAYISGRADPMIAAFGFLGLYLGLRMLRAQGHRRWAWGIGAGVSLLASALSSELGLALLVVWLILAFGQRPRVGWLGPTGLALAVLLGYLSLRLPAEQDPPATTDSAALLVRPIVAARALAEYAGLLVLPRHLQVERDVVTPLSGSQERRMEMSAWRELQTLLGLALAAAGIFALWQARRRVAIGLPLLLAAVCYLPISGLITLNHTVSENWLYLPSAFLFLSGAAALESLGWLAARRLTFRLATAGLALWLLFLPLRTFWRTFDWKDERTILNRSIAAGGDSVRLWLQVAELELSEGKFPAAKAALGRALAIDTVNAKALLYLAAVAAEGKDFSRARDLLGKVIDPPELRARAEESLVLLENRESGKVNLMRLRLASRLGQPNWAIEKRYVKALAAFQHPDRALSELQTSLNQAPYRAESWQMMSQLLARVGRPNESALALQEAEACDMHLHRRTAAPL